MAASVPYTANKKPKEWRRGLFIEWVNSIVTNPVIKKTPDEIEGLVRAFAVAKGYFSEGEADSIEISTRLIQAVAATKEKEPGQCLFRQSLSLESQGSLKKARLVTVRPFVANETYLKKNHQCIIDSRTAAAKMATTTFGSNPKSNAGSSKPIPTPIPTPMPKSNTEPTSKPTPLHTSSAPGLNHAPAEFSEAYKVALAEALAVQPHMSLRKFQLLHALLFQATVLQAMEMGYSKLSEMTEANITMVCPGADTLASGLKLAQEILDRENESDFDAAQALGVFPINDAGNKKKAHLTQRFYSAWNKTLGKVVLHHHAATTVADLTSAVKADLKQLNVTHAQVLGGCTDNAPDVFVTFTRNMQAEFPDFIGVGCVLHALNLMIMRPIFTAFGEQVKPKDGGGGGGGSGGGGGGGGMANVVSPCPDPTIPPNTITTTAATTPAPAAAPVPTAAVPGPGSERFLGGSSSDNNGRRRVSFVLASPALGDGGEGGDGGKGSGGEKGDDGSGSNGGGEGEGGFDEVALADGTKRFREVGGAEDSARGGVDWKGALKRPRA